MVNEKDVKKWLENKYKKEELRGAKYIDSKQRINFRKWVNKQKF